MDFDIVVRQQPQRSRMCGYGEKVDRRPIDPPPVLQLLMKDPAMQQTVDRSIGSNLFVNAVLCDPDNNNTEISILSDGRTRSLTGSMVSSLFRLRDENGDFGLFFIFQDLSVRLEGTYRLKFSLFGIDDERITFYKCIYSEPFNVYAAKKFPGMGESSALSKAFAEQGIRMRIRKEVRQRKRRLSDLPQDDYEDV